MAFDPYRTPNVLPTSGSEDFRPEAGDQPMVHAERRWLCFGVLAFISPFLNVGGIALTGMLSQRWNALDHLWIYCWIFPSMLVCGCVAVGFWGHPRLLGGVLFFVVGTLLTWFNFEFFWGIVASV